MMRGLCLFISFGTLLFVTASDKFFFFCFVFWAKTARQQPPVRKLHLFSSCTKAVHELHKIKLHVSFRLQGFPLKAGALIWSCLSMFVIQKKVCIQLIWGVLTVTVLFLGFGSPPAPWWLCTSWHTRLSRYIVWWHALWHGKDNSSGQAGQTQ